MKNITIKDIAKELGISISTVSRALQDKPEISLETRKKVRAFADLYHYMPNSLALRLRSQKTMIIGIVIPEIVHHFFSRVISGVEKVANEKDYNVMICLSNESYDKEKLNIKMLTNGSVDGLLVSLSKETLKKNDYEHLKNLSNYNIPLVLFDRVSDEINCDKVIVDDVSGAYRATRHLIEIGCKKIALITTPDHISVGKLRAAGYKKALKESGRAVENDFIVKVDEQFSVEEQIAVLLNNDDKLPDGILAVNEIYAARAMKIAKEKGLTIPEDIAIIGFTDGLISEFSTPSLSTVAQHGFTMGEHAAELLLERINQADSIEKNFETKIISTDLRIRKSTEK
mgnify:CR=1 FL=1|tara:strand:- start:259119 stop:260144 length:1026 start_codon:yes stop_codon:yes gene_type:complete